LQAPLRKDERGAPLADPGPFHEGQEEFN